MAPSAGSQGQASLFRAALHEISPVGEIPVINTHMTVAQTSALKELLLPLQQLLTLLPLPVRRR